MEPLVDICPLLAFAPSWRAMVGAILCGLLVFASVVDVRRRVVPDRVVLSLCFLWAGSFAAVLIDGLVSGGETFGSAARAVLAGLAGAFALSGFALACAGLASRVGGRPALGMGDVKLLFALGLYFGITHGLICLCAACVLAVLYVIARRILEAALLRRGSGSDASHACDSFDGTFPFVPFLAASSIVLVVLANMGCGR